MQSVEEVFEDYKARRGAIIKALTVDFNDFYSACDPDRPNLCLYGHSNGTWEVALPVEEVPSELPEPVLGINFARDGMRKQDWIAFCAVHSDTWLMSVAFFNAARFDRKGRDHLFRHINSIPTIYEVISGKDLEGRDEEALDDPEHDDEGGDDDACTECGGLYKQGEFWIQCDRCKKWYHGKCVRMTQTRAEQIQFWNCPRCKSSKF